MRLRHRAGQSRHVVGRPQLGGTNKNVGIGPVVLNGHEPKAGRERRWRGVAVDQEPVARRREVGRGVVIRFHQRQRQLAADIEARRSSLVKHLKQHLHRIGRDLEDEEVTTLEDVSEVSGRHVGRRDDAVGQRQDVAVEEFQHPDGVVRSETGIAIHHREVPIALAQPHGHRVGSDEDMLAVVGWVRAGVGEVRRINPTQILLHVEIDVAVVHGVDEQLHAQLDGAVGDAVVVVIHADVGDVRVAHGKVGPEVRRVVRQLRDLRIEHLDGAHAVIDPLAGHIAIHNGGIPVTLPQRHLERIGHQADGLVSPATVGAGIRVEAEARVRENVRAEVGVIRHRPAEGRVVRQARAILHVKIDVTAGAEGLEGCLHRIAGDVEDEILHVVAGIVVIRHRHRRALRQPVRQVGDVAFEQQARAEAVVDVRWIAIDHRRVPQTVRQREWAGVGAHANDLVVVARTGAGIDLVAGRRVEADQREARAAVLEEEIDIAAGVDGFQFQQRAVGRNVDDVIVHAAGEIRRGGRRDDMTVREAPVQFVAAVDDRGEKVGDQPDRHRLGADAVVHIGVADGTIDHRDEPVSGLQRDRD